MSKETDIRLSHSSATLLQGCEQRYVHYKVKGIDKDKDYDDNQVHFAVGSSFHHILEMSEHKKPEKIGELLEYCVANIGLPEDQVGLVHAMVIKYLRLHKTSGLELVKAEIAISDEVTIGYIDAIFKEEDGSWWICDLKTAKTLSSTLVSRLPMDRQLNLYAAYAPQIAEELKLDMKQFKGCRYKVTTKSAAKHQSKESYIEYVMRMADKLIRTYDIIVPIEVMNPAAIYDQHYKTFLRSKELRGGSTPDRNWNYCESYFKPCPYWSNCHGKEFTQMSDELEVICLK